MIELEGSTITIDAAGATGTIMDVTHYRGGDFVLQVKKNCLALYAELMGLFDGLAKSRKRMGKNSRLNMAATIAKR